MTNAAGATPDHRRLDAFAGSWSTAGEVSVGPTGSSVKFHAKDSYEWVAGGFFLLHRFDANMPEGNVSGVEIIGYDPETKTYPARSFDSQGKTVDMRGRVKGDSWVFTGETTRFTGDFRDGGTTLSGLWESRSNDDSTWQPWMTVTLRKVD
jgi:hypothetical protein